MPSCAFTFLFSKVYYFLIAIYSTNNVCVYLKLKDSLRKLFVPSTAGRMNNEAKLFLARIFDHQ